MKLILLPLAVLLTILTTGVSANDDFISLTQKQQQNLGIEVIQAQSSTTVPVSQVPAIVVIPPAQEYWVSSAQPGRVVRVLVALGDTVEKDQALVEIQSAALLAVQREYLRSLNDFKLAQNQWHRSQSLLDEGIISKRRWLQSQNEYESSQAVVDETKQRLLIAGQSETDINQLARRRRLSNTLAIRAPASGVILERMVSVGQSLDAQAPLFKLADLSHLWLHISLPQEQVQQVSVGDEVVIEAAATQAHISLIGRSVDAVTQSVLLRAVITDSNALRPGQKLSVSLSRSTHEPLLQLPASAIMNSEGQAYVFVQNDPGFELRPVTIKGRQAQSVTISTGISRSDVIAFQGIAALKASWLGMGGGE